MDSYEAVYKALLLSPVPREGIGHGAVRKIEMSWPTPPEDDPYDRLVRELDTIPFRWFL